MRILHVSESLDPANGGTPAVAKALAAAQAGLGCSVTILTRDEPARAEAIRESMVGIPHADRVEIVGVDPSGGVDRFVSRTARGWVEGHAEAFDFAHLHSMWSPIPHGAARGLRRVGVPFTLCPHGMLDRWSMSQSTLKKKLHLGLVSRATMRGCAFIHALNEHEAACIDAFGFGRPAWVLNNGVFAEEYADLPARGTFRAVHPRLSDRRYVTFISRLHFKKGLDHLADAFERIAGTHGDVDLVVVGPDGGARADFETAISSAGLRDRVHVMGPMYGPEKLAVLVDAACFCLPSRQEGFSIAICEALACGTPVVISEACNFPEIATEGVGVVEPLSADRIADGLDRVLSDPEGSVQMGARGRAMILERFTWPAIAERSLGLYRRAISG